MNSPSLKPDLEQAKKFLKVLDKTSEFTFHTFDGNQDRNSKNLTRMFHGSLEQHARSLVKLNKAGAGVFVTINQTDLLGRSKENIKRVRAAATVEPTSAVLLGSRTLARRTISGTSLASLTLPIRAIQPWFSVTFHYPPTLTVHRVLL